MNRTRTHHDYAFTGSALRYWVWNFIIKAKKCATRDFKLHMIDDKKRRNSFPSVMGLGLFLRR